MARGGAHNTKPSVLKLLAGNPGKRPLNEHEPDPALLDDLKPPTGLDRFGKQAWNENAPLLRDLGLLTVIDRNSLASYCMAYSRWRNGNIALARSKPAYDNYRQIAVTVEKAEQAMRLLAGEFGMSPSSRSRLSVTPQGPLDEFEQWQRGNRSSG